MVASAAGSGLAKGFAASDAMRIVSSHRSRHFSRLLTSRCSACMRQYRWLAAAIEITALGWLSLQLELTMQLCSKQHTMLRPCRLSEAIIDKPITRLAAGRAAC